MINSDHASVLRGVKTGATVRISEFAPNISSCDIGGDVLHDLNNANNYAFYKKLSKHGKTFGYNQRRHWWIRN